MASNTPGKDGYKPISENQVTGKKNPKPKSGGASASDVIPPHQDANESGEGQHQSKPRWLRVLEALALAAGVAYAAVTYLMWSDSHKNFTIEERAWLSVLMNLPNSVNEGTQIQGAMTVFNTGKTTSRKILLECGLSVQRNTDAVSIDYSKPHTIHDMGMLAPNSLSNIQCFSKGPDQLETVSKQQSDDLVNGRAYLAMYGQGRHEDIFGGVHWLRFCVWTGYYKGGVYNAKSCTDYNDTGDGSPK